MRLTLIALLLLQSVSLGQELDIPSPIKGAENDPISIVAVTNATEVIFHRITPGLKMFPGEMLANKKAAVVWGAKGEYKILAIIAVNNKPYLKEITVVIGNGVPVPPNPVPPNPIPPVPPVPPVPPSPDGLTGLLQQASTMDMMGAKKPMVAKVYDTIAKGIDRPELTTVGHVVKGIDVTWNLSLGKGTLPNVKKVIDLHLNEVYKENQDTPLTDLLRKSVASKITELKTALEKVQ